MKTCYTCKVDKTYESFHKHKKQKDGYNPTCKECLSAKQKIHYAANKDKYKQYRENIRDYRLTYAKEYNKKYREENRDELIQRNREYYNNNKVVILQKQKNYIDKNRDKILETKRVYYVNNRDDLLEKNMEYYWNNRDDFLERSKKWRDDNPGRDADNHRKYREENREQYNDYRRRLMAEKLKDPEFKVKTNLRKRINHALKVTGTQKCTKTEELLGCPLPEFKKYLESMFDDKMNWNNYGSYWHIDHERPCASFDLTDLNQQLVCFNWSNMIPMEAKENMSKGDKIMVTI